MLGHYVMREDYDDTIAEITRRLDLLQRRFEGFDRLRRTGSTIDEQIITDMENNYTRGLEHLHSLKATEQLQEYKTWYKRYLIGGDPA